MKAQPYTNKMKKYHDNKIEKREFIIGDLVLLLNSWLRFVFGQAQVQMDWSLLGYKTIPSWSS